MKQYQASKPVQVWARRLAVCAMFLGLSATVGYAQGKAAGEISAARQASVNGVAVRSSGVTIFSNSKILTGEKGSAAVSLGRRGKLELGAKTNLLLQFSGTQIGGDLQSGRLILSLPAGIALALNTPKGLVKADGLQPTVVTIESASDKTKVLAHLGETKLISGTKTERILPGDEVALNGQGKGEGWQRRRIWAASLLDAGSAAGVTSASQTIGPVLQPAAYSAKATTTFSSLLSTGINFSLAQLAGAGRDPEQLFETSVTCRDVDNFLCRRRSGSGF